MNCFYDCIDCGSEFCPCELAESGECLVCSRLSGSGSCNCDWKGICVYNEFVNAGFRAKKRRPEFEAEIVKHDEYESDIFVLVINVGRTLAQKAGLPGSYVFLKHPDDDSFYNIPISVMKADTEEGLIYLAIKVSGVKSRRISECDKKVVVRGIYRNGIIGVSKLFGIRGRVEPGRRIMIVTKGIGIAPAILIKEWAQERSTVDIYADCDKLDRRIISDYLPAGDIRYIDLARDFSHRDGKPGEKISGYYSKGNYDIVVVLTSDYYIEEIKKIIDISACANNFHLCCGEGICGACGFTDAKGRCYKMCRCSEILTSMM
ncbi:MAG: hypothetical protein IJP24_00385 [Firmicutes bacterium]|nr:hypothetical protein [Bacillota bacterium]